MPYKYDIFFFIKTCMTLDPHPPPSSTVSVCNFSNADQAYQYLWYNQSNNEDRRRQNWWSRRSRTSVSLCPSSLMLLFTLPIFPPEGSISHLVKGWSPLCCKLYVSCASECSSNSASFIHVRLQLVRFPNYHAVASGLGTWLGSNLWFMFALSLEDNPIGIPCCLNLYVILFILFGWFCAFHCSQTSVLPSSLPVRVGDVLFFSHIGARSSFVLSSSLVVCIFLFFICGGRSPHVHWW